MRNFIFFILIIFSVNSFAQENGKLIFSDDFNSKLNNWNISNTILRQSQISGGKLIDYFGEYGYVNANLIAVSFDKSIDYEIHFSMANLNNKKGYRYKAYTPKQNGKFKEEMVDNPIWGFVWGFKDWNNYNAFILQKTTTSYGSTKISYKAFSTVNGTEVVNDDWTQDLYYSFNDETDYYDFVITKSNFGFMVYINKPWFSEGKKLGDKTLLCSLKGVNEWYGSYFGPYIGAGAKVSVDYIKIQTLPKKEYVSNFSLTMSDINLIFNSVAESIKESSPNSYFAIETKMDGTRTIKYASDDFDGLPADEKALGLELHKKIFEIVFGMVNYERDVPINSKDLVYALKSKNIKNIEFKSKNHVYNYTWDELLAK
jgi:hypothetical protein